MVKSDGQTHPEPRGVVEFCRFVDGQLSRISDGVHHALLREVLWGHVASDGQIVFVDEEEAQQGGQNDCGERVFHSGDENVVKMEVVDRNVDTASMHTSDGTREVRTRRVRTRGTRLNIEQ